MGMGGFDEGMVDNTDETTIGEIVYLVAGTVITIAAEHTALKLKREFLSINVIH
jgi:hypothetical protein